MTDDELLTNLQLSVNKNIYESVMISYKNALYYSDESKAVNAVLSGLATNLGIMLAQLPADYQQQYLETVNKIVLGSITDVTQNLDKWQYGTVGHA
jgi:hypothetical protein